MKKDHIKSNLFEDIRKWRLKAGHTQEELADLLKVNRKAVGEWERDEKRPNKTNRLKLGDIFNAKVTLKGITENHIDMKISKDASLDSDPGDEEWYKKTIDSLIQQHAVIIDKYTTRTDRQIDGLETDKLHLWELVGIKAKSTQETKQ